MLSISYTANTPVTVENKSTVYRITLSAIGGLLIFFGAYEGLKAFVKDMQDAQITTLMDYASMFAVPMFMALVVVMFLHITGRMNRMERERNEDYKEIKDKLKFLRNATETQMRALTSQVNHEFEMRMMDYDVFNVQLNKGFGAKKDVNKIVNDAFNETMKNIETRIGANVDNWRK